MRIDVKDHQKLMSIQRTLTWVAQRGPEGKKEKQLFPKVQEDSLSTYHTSYLFSGDSWVSNPKSIYRANKVHKRK